jgi:hypothetical protein
MKYSLRSLMIAALVLPPVIAGAIWLFAPLFHLVTPRGSSANKAEFLRVVKQPYSGTLYSATDRCFVVGALASDYKGVLAKVDRRGALDHHIKFMRLAVPLSATATQYEFWCEGKNPDTDCEASVYVIVDGTPPTITHAEVLVWARAKL